MYVIAKISNKSVAKLINNLHKIYRDLDYFYKNYNSLSGNNDKTLS